MSLVIRGDLVRRVSSVRLRQQAEPSLPVILPLFLSCALNFLKWLLVSARILPLHTQGATIFPMYLGDLRDRNICSITNPENKMHSY